VFSICRWKNTLRLKSRHTSALSLGETKKREATLELNIVNAASVNYRPRIVDLRRILANCRSRSTEEGWRATLILPGSFSDGTETNRPSCWELIGGGVVTESTRQSTTMHLPSRGCKNWVSEWQCNRIAMARWRSPRAKRLMRSTSVARREKFESFNSHFLPPRQVVEPQAKARTDSYNFYVSIFHVIENFL
jgi:hypothetical protein